MNNSIIDQDIRINRATGTDIEPITPDGIPVEQLEKIKLEIEVKNPSKPETP